MSTTTLAQLARAATERVLWPYQRAWAGAFLARPYLGILGGRQIGKDWTLAWLLLLDALLTPGAEWHVVSATQTHAEGFIRDVRHHLRFLEVLAKTQGLRLPPLDGEGTKTRIAWKSGAVIHAHAATTRSVIGQRGSFVLNEVAMIPGAEEITETAYAMVRRARQIGRRARMILVSNASRKGSYWHRWWTDKQERRSGWELITARWSECQRSMGWTASQVAKERAEILADLGGSVAAFGQWFECEWRAGSEGLLSPTTLDRQTYTLADLEQIPGTPQVIGYDLGRTTDPAALAPVLLRSPEDHRALVVETLRETPYHLQRERLRALATSRPTRRVVIDAQGIGHSQAEEVTRELQGVAAVTSFHTSSRGTYSKWDLFAGLRDSLDSGRLWIPGEDVDLRMELEAVEATATATGRQTVHQPRDKRGHGDRAFALALANHGATHAPSSGVSAPVKRRHRHHHPLV